MIIVYFLIFVLILIGIKPKLNSFNDGYLSRSQTTAIKGIFVILVFCRHFKQYVTLNDNFLDKSFSIADDTLRQLIVVMFLFYSGYGIIKQIQLIESEYVDHFLNRRLLPVWLQYAICVCFFIITDLALGLLNNYSLSDILLSFIGWTSIGNSTWFMFVTFALYIFVFVSVKFFKFEKLIWNVVIFTALSCALGLFLYIFKPSHWWDTLLCFALGMWFGLFKEKIDEFVENPKNYLLTAILITITFLGLLFVDYIINLGAIYIILPLLFALFAVAVTMKVKIGNPVLDFFGKHIFSIYILQRIPMMIFKNVIENIYVYFAVCFAVTVAVSVGFDRLFGLLKAVIIKRRTKKRC